MNDWPPQNVDAVYVPPGDPPELLSREELKIRLAGVRMRAGLPAADEHLEEVLDCSPEARRLSALDSIWTRAEREERDRPLDLATRARRVLALGDDDSGVLEMGWRDGRKVIIVHLHQDLGHLHAALEDELGDRVVILSAAFTQAQLRHTRDLVHEQLDELKAFGVQIMQFGVSPGHVNVSYAALDPAAAEKVLRERFGEAVRAEWHGGPTLRTFRPFPFGSWLAEEDRLTVFYALHHNGERPGGCDAYETDDEVIVSLRIIDWRGAKTLIGGFTPSHATVQLARPLDGRAVIDDAAHRPRPHWSDV